MTGAGNPPVAAVVVTFRPDKTMLFALLKALSGKVDVVVLVSNDGALDDQLVCEQLVHPSALHVKSNPQNMGLARAQNQGVEVAKKLGVDAVLFLDQDSQPLDDCIGRLAAALDLLKAQGRKVAAVASAHQSTHTGHWSGHVRITPLGFKRKSCSPTEQVVRADFVISSGSMVSMAALDDIGGMDDTLFIDHVDTEWCLRAAHHGYELYGVCGAKIQHQIGDDTQRVWLFGWRHVPRHSSLRYFYMYRNSVLLYKRPYISLTWKCWDFFRSLRLLAFVALFSPTRFAAINSILKGWYTGLTTESFGPKKPAPAP